MEHTIILKQSQLEHYPSVHHWLADQLHLPDHYGHNLDALWDCLCRDIELPLHIVWHRDQADRADYAAVIAVFQDAADEIEGLSFQYVDDCWQ